MLNAFFVQHCATILLYQKIQIKQKGLSSSLKVFEDSPRDSMICRVNYGEYTLGYDKMGLALCNGLFQSVYSNTDPSYGFILAK